MSVRSFPVDRATLTLLRAACEINEDTGRTHLQDFLQFGAVETDRVLLNEDEVEEDGIPIYEVYHEPGTEPWSEHGVIVSLVDEILRLRGEE